MTLDDATATEALGPKCPDCGWRRGQHRPAVAFSGEQWLTACPRYEAPPRAVT